MILYAETNFVIELAFEQGEHAVCRALLDLAEARPDGEIELALPAFSVGEAYQKHVGQERERWRLHDRLVRQINQLSRSRPHAERSGELRRLTGFLVESSREEGERLEAVLADLRHAATVIPMTGAVIAEGSRLQASRGLGPQDALVYASVLGDLRRRRRAGARRRAPGQPEHCFVTRDDDFTNDDIRSDLEALGCKILFRFDAALQYVQNRLA